MSVNELEQGRFCFRHFFFLTLDNTRMAIDRFSAVRSTSYVRFLIICVLIYFRLLNQLIVQQVLCDTQNDQILVILVEFGVDFMVQYKILENVPKSQLSIKFWILFESHRIKPKSYGAHEYLGWFEDSSVVG